ncbi:hypothetical protein, partial [Klebsiella variicola]|uniref:hypothetical protein n=1 Tax=Klebsiella variicola TaxID=244366 RepID=UPI00214D71F0
RLAPYPGYPSAPVCSPGKRSGTGEMYPDSGWRLIRATSQPRFVAPVSAAPPGRCTRIAAGALSGLPVSPGL